MQLMQGFSMTALTPRVRIGLGACLLLIVLKFFWMPFDEWTQDHYEIIGRIHRSIEKKRFLLQNGDALKAALQKEKASLDRIRSYAYPDAADPQAVQLALQKDIEVLAQRFRIKIVNTEWLYAADGPVILAPIRITCDGAPGDILSFLAGIEGYERFIGIETLKLLTAGKGERVGLTLEVTALGVKAVKAS